VEYIVKVRAQFKRRSTANNVEILVPVPDDADSPKFRVSLSSSSISPPLRSVLLLAPDPSLPPFVKD
jgi:hypothetical protein